MARNRIVIEGIREFSILPQELIGAVEPIVKAGAERAANRVRDAYPRGPTGNLKAGVKVVRRRTSNPAIVDYAARSTAYHAHLYEFGTARGQRARPTFLPITADERHATTAAIVALVKAAGFKVSGA